MSIPANHVIAEGRTLRAAIEDAAAHLGVPANFVEHKLDLAHFRSPTGTGIGADTVRIFAWARDLASVAPVAAAEAWTKGLLAAMERTGGINAEVRGGAVVVTVDVGEEGRHLVGRGGATLRAIQHLLERALVGQFPDQSFRFDVARSEPRDDRGRDDRDDRPREFRGPRDDRPRDDRPRDDRPRDDRPRDDRPRDDRPRDAGGDDRPRDAGRDDRRGRDDRGPRRDDRRDRGPRRGNDEGELRKLARKLAQKVIETGEPQVIRRELSSYDRRIVHVEISEIAGVASRSVGEGAERRVEICMAAPSDAGEE